MKEQTNYIDQLNQERLKKIDEKITTLTKELKNAKTAYDRALKNKEKKISMIKEWKNTYEYLIKEQNIDENINKKRRQVINIDNQLSELKIKKEELTWRKTLQNQEKINSLTEELINHLEGKKIYKSYKEKQEPAVGKQLWENLSNTKAKQAQAARDILQEDEEQLNQNNPWKEHDPKLKFIPIEDIADPSAEKNIYNIWSYEDSPALMEALERDTPNEDNNTEQNDLKNDYYNTFNEEYFEEKKSKKQIEIEAKKQELDIKYGDLEKDSHQIDGHKIRLNKTNKPVSGSDKYQAKNKKNYKRYQHIETEPANRVKKGIKKKNRNVENDIQKY